MARYIDADALIERFKFKRDTDINRKKYSGLESAISQVSKQPTADVVSKKAYEQVKWERDTAIEQLKSYGVGFCENADVVEVKHGGWVYWQPDGTNHLWRCSVCDGAISTPMKFVADHIKYCEHCGAKMKGGADNG